MHCFIMEVGQFTENSEHSRLSAFTQFIFQNLHAVGLGFCKLSECTIVTFYSIRRIYIRLISSRYSIEMSSIIF